MNVKLQCLFAYKYISPTTFHGTLGFQGTPAEKSCSRVSIQLTASWGVMSAFS
jgi:hypothetical protein